MAIPFIGDVYLYTPSTNASNDDDSAEEESGELQFDTVNDSSVIPANKVKILNLVFVFISKIH